MIFWITIAAMIAVLLAMLSFGLLRKDRGDMGDPLVLNRLVYQDQLDELQSDLDRGAITRDEFDCGVEEIEKRILHEMRSEETVPAGRCRFGKATLAMLFAAIPAAALFIYFQIGNPSLVNYAPALHGGATVTADNRLDFVREQSVDEAMLKEYLSESPQNMRAWLQYARLLAGKEQWRDALEAMDKVFETGSEAAKKSPSLILERVFLMQRTGDPMYRSQMVKELERALKEDPDNAEVLFYAGEAAYRAGFYREAAGYWSRLTAFYPEGSPEAVRLLDAIADAKNREMMGGYF